MRQKESRRIEGSDAVLKSDLRKAALAARSALDFEKRIKYSNMIANRIFGLCEFKNSKNIMCYSSYKSEADTNSICERIIKDGKTLYLPRCIVDTREIEACRIDDIKSLLPGAYGIYEPDTPKADAAEIDMVIVPMVAFDRKLYRIGYGAGYYDRFLCQTNAIKCGIAFSVQEVEIDAVEQTDIPMDMIVTERELIM